MKAPYNRRNFMKLAAGSIAAFPMAAAAASSADLARGSGQPSANEPLYKVSLAQWSLVRPLQAGKIDNLDFAVLTRENGIDAVEYVNQFFMDKATDRAYLSEMKRRADGEGVRSVLIMCDREGNIGDPDDAARTTAVENHYKWVEAAKFLGCHAIRVNAYSEGSYEEQQKLVADGLRRLTEFGAEHDISVIVENHGGFSSNAQWLIGVVEQVDHPGFGMLPDFGNFQISETESYDSYQGVKELMPYSKGVSVKPRGWDANHNQVEIDLNRMMGIVVDAGYHGYCGIEYGGREEGQEWEAIRGLHQNLIAVRDELAG